VSGLGSLLNIHTGANSAHHSLAGDLLFFELLERGFYLAPRGLIALSLAVEPNHIGEFLRAMRDIVTTRAALFG
jgi:glutamate-1-semialdehyde 2,1-aminomutase